MRTFALLMAVSATAYSLPSCGQTPIKPNTDVNLKIVGGTVAVPFSWPWQALMCYKGDCSFQCGGTVIDDRWIMTAGHCVNDDSTPSNYMFKAAAFDNNSTTMIGEQIGKVKAIHLHPKYQPPPPENYYDIALIELVNPLTFNDHVQPICLPKNDTDAIKPGNTAWVTGWGLTSEGGDVSEHLRQVDVPFIDFQQCEEEYPDTIDEEVMVCAGREGKDSCQGDSGGPFVTQAPSGAWYQIGIVSGGEGCADYGKPGIYARVQAFCGYIETTTRGKVKCQDIV